MEKFNREFQQQEGSSRTQNRISEHKDKSLEIILSEEQRGGMGGGRKPMVFMRGH